jgi:hypothetical protein
MPNPVTHIIVPMLIVETYRRYFAKKKFSRWYVFIAGFMGGMPDFDLLVALLMTGGFDKSYHRSYTHTLLIPILLTAVGLAMYYFYSNRKLRGNGWRAAYILLFMTSIGIASHVALDALDGLSTWFYPFEWRIHLPDFQMDQENFRAAILDGVMLFAWLLYDENLLNDILRFLRIKKTG